MATLGTSVLFGCRRAGISGNPEMIARMSDLSKREGLAVGLLGSDALNVTEIGNETYTTVAHASYVNSGTSSIDFCDPFFKQSSTGQYQTAIHEAMHLIWNIGDNTLAKAVGIQGVTGPAASAAWHDALKEKCK